MLGKFEETKIMGQTEGAEMKQDVFLPEDYRPAEDEPFMNERQMEYFRRKLLNWKAELLDESRDTIEGLQENTRNIPDVADRASEETDRALELRTRDRQRKLVAKIDAAIRRIDEGEYGYCDVTGEPISLKRLDARPIADFELRDLAADRPNDADDFVAGNLGVALRPPIPPFLVNVGMADAGVLDLDEDVVVPHRPALELERLQLSRIVERGSAPNGGRKRGTLHFDSGFARSLRPTSGAPRLPLLLPHPR